MFVHRSDGKELNFDKEDCILKASEHTQCM